MPETQAVAEFIGGPLDGAEFDPQPIGCDLHVVANPVLGTFDYYYYGKRNLSRARLNANIRLGGTYSYERRGANDRVRYVLVKSE